MTPDRLHGIVELAERVLIAECGSWSPDFTAEFLVWLGTIRPKLDPLVCLVADRQRQITLRYERPAIGERVDEALNQLRVGSHPDDIKIVENTLKMLLGFWARANADERSVGPSSP